MTIDQTQHDEDIPAGSRTLHLDSDGVGRLVCVHCGWESKIAKMDSARAAFLRHRDAAHTLDPDEPAPDLDPEGHFGVEGETWDDDEIGESVAQAIRRQAIADIASTFDVPEHLISQAEEPIESRLRRAWLNGFHEGVDRTAYMEGRWDR